MIFSQRSGFLTITLVIVIYGLLTPLTTYANTYKSLKWVDLIPEADLDALLNPPPSILAIPDGSAEDAMAFEALANGMTDAITQSKQPMTEQEKAYFDALTSTNINADYNEQNIRIAGFVVPVEYSDDLMISEFFLVPYFGACIHVPPPPPNQIIYVRYEKGLKLDVLYDPFWIEGKLSLEITENNLALSAYSMSADDIKPYEGYSG